jgi:hypothetical protein
LYIKAEEEIQMKNIVHVVLKDGVIWEAYGEGDVELVVYDLDTDDDIEREDVEEAVRELEARSDAGELDHI